MILETIQKREKLNYIDVNEDFGPGNGYHEYKIYRCDNSEKLNTIEFQKGPRKLGDSIHGILDTDLLEIVRSRLTQFQKGEFKTRENAIAITHIEEVLLWMNKRVEDRIERNVLGSNIK
jgi:hypothetical protein